jgi:hypothetical protein
MALQGTLGDFGIADIFQLIGQQQKTGVLHLSGKDEEVHIGFKDGNVVRAETAARKRKELLGHMLVRAGLIGQPQLDVALDEQRRTLRRLGDILVSSGALTREALKEMTYLQTTETLYRLFAWKQGSYAFEQGEVDFDPETVTPVRSESVLMEGFRRVDEWPGVRKVVSSGRMTFEKLKDAPAPRGGGDDDFGLDAAFGEAGDDEPKKGELSRAERRLMELWDPARTVGQLIDASRLGEFETCKGLAGLCKQGYLAPIAPSGKDDDDRLGKVEKSVGERLRESAGSAVVTVLLAAAVVFLFGQSGLGSARLSSGELPVSDQAAQRLLARGQLERLRAALEIYQLEHGELPEALDALVQEQLASASDLQFPWGERYYYRRTAGRSFVLLPPLR